MDVIVQVNIIEKSTRWKRTRYAWFRGDCIDHHNRKTDSSDDDLLREPKTSFSSYLFTNVHNKQRALSSRVRWKRSMCGSCSSLLVILTTLTPWASMTSFKHLKPPSPRNSAMTHPAAWYLSNVGLDASHIVSRFSFSIGMAVECFKVGMVVVRNFTVLTIRTSAQTTIRDQKYGISIVWWQFHRFPGSSCSFSN